MTTVDCHVVPEVVAPVNSHGSYSEPTKTLVRYPGHREVQ